MAPNISKFLFPLIAALVIFAGGFFLGWGLRPQTGTLYKVVEIVDGDTFFIANHQLIRLDGLDAPELTNCYGQQSKAGLAKIIEGKSVELREIKIDHYGNRILATVYLDGKIINEPLIKNGFAVYQGAGISNTASLKAANDFARENHLGIFSQECYQVTPPDPNCAIKGNLDRHGAGPVFYPPGCREYSHVAVELYLGDTWFCSPAVAQKAGFALSPTCRQ